jgi:hypothetical protein
MINRHMRDQVLDAEDCSNHCPDWFILAILLAALVCTATALVLG